MSYNLCTRILGSHFVINFCDFQPWWNKYCEHCKYTGEVCNGSGLRPWNATFNNATSYDPFTITFETEEDATAFVLRFS